MIFFFVILFTLIPDIIFTKYINHNNLCVIKNDDNDLYKDPHFIYGRNGIVHLFEWKFKDVAYECEHFLSKLGYGGVQISPVTENIIIPTRPWYERYQPLTYKIISRSGNEEQFRYMVDTCNNVGVRVYVDVVINHMAADSATPIGTGGSRADPSAKKYPDVGYTWNDFHKTCLISNYQNVEEVRNCELEGLHDLDHTKENVQNKIIEFLNKIIDYGVAGIRVDAAKHMWPEDLKYIYSKLNNLNTNFFPNGTRPFIYQEVIDIGGEAVKATDYTSFGRVTDFMYGAYLGATFRGKNKLSSLRNWGASWGLLNSSDSLVFIDNHDNQRGHGAGGGDILTYKTAKLYKMAIAYMLSQPFSIARIMSSYEYENPSQGPPHYKDNSIKDVKYNHDLTCRNGWVCEHRWRQIYSMNVFRNVVAGTSVENWWDNGSNQIAYSRGNRGFIAFNNDGYNLNTRLQTGMPPGYYCDIITGEKRDGSCTGKLVIINNEGIGNIYIGNWDFDGMIAIHANSRLWNPSKEYMNAIMTNYTDLMRGYGYNYTLNLSAND